MNKHPPWQLLPFPPSYPSLPHVPVVISRKLTSISLQVYMLKYDSSHGIFKGEVANQGNDLVVNGKTVASGFDTIIDSGTTIMYGPPSAVKKLYAAVPGSAVYDSSQGYYSYPCDSAPTIAFSWGGKNWEITPEK